jgi:site-specific recombinase XerD
MTKDGVKVTIKKLCWRAEVSARLGAHTFRHTFGTQSLINGDDIREVQSLLGHSTLTMTLRYVDTVKSEQAIIRHRNFSPVDNLKLK